MFGLSPVLQAVVLLGVGLTGAVLGVVTDFVALAIVLQLLGLFGLLVLCWQILRRPQWLPRVQHAVELWVSANPDFELNDARVPAVLREALNTLAAHSRGQKGRVTAEVDEATARFAQDRALLRGLIESMDGALVAATIDGRILLYNAAAVDLLAQEETLALGRSLFVVFRRWAVSHFVARLTDSGRRVTGVLASRGGRTFHARFSPLSLDGRQGFLLALEPLAAFAPGQSDLAQFIEPRRARLANLQAAAETLQDQADLAEEQRQRLVAVIATETAELVRSFAQLSERLAADSALPLDDVAARDLLPLLADRLALGVPDREAYAGVWLRAESASLVLLVDAIARWWQARSCVPAELGLSVEEGHVVIAMTWQGDGIGADELRDWQQRRMAVDEEESAWSPQQLLETQGGTLWGEPGDNGGSLFLLLARAEEPLERGNVSDSLPARPEYFDFGLFDTPVDGADRDLPLNRLALTVFDTETTGLNPSQGDEIISIGAIRVLNGRLIGQEIFETLVRTDKPIHPESQKIHGIHAGMLRDAPGQEESIQRLLAFVGDNLLLGHNVAFDLRFLEIASRRYGYTLPAMSLDTLLLSSVVYPERDQHRLEDIAERLGVTVLGRHTSLGDALLTAEVFCRMLPLLEQKGIRTLGEALDASRESWYARLGY